jgi:hypothetical protein
MQRNIIIFEINEQVQAHSCPDNRFCDFDAGRRSFSET